MTEGSQNGWNEYRRMVVDWHEEDKKERALLAAELAEYRKETSEKLDQISQTLVEFRTQRKAATWFLGIALPGAVSLAVSWLVTKFGLH